LEKELAARPPAEMFLAAYFEAQGWWRSPALRNEPPMILPQSDLPEFEP